MFLVFTIFPAILLLVLEPETKRELSAYIGIYLAVAISLGYPLMGFLSNLMVVNDLRQINNICRDLRMGTAVKVADLPNETDDEHELLELKRNINFVIHAVSGREQHLRRHLNESVEESSRLWELSVRDPLSGLFNRRYFDEKIVQCAAEVSQSDMPSYLMLLDVDNFKHINDAFGHQEGDRVIKDIGRIIMNSTRIDQDVPFRYGGDEFGLIFLNVDLPIVVEVARRISDGFMMKWAMAETSLSIGIAPFEECGLKNESAANHWIRSADKAVYTGKNRGGNCIIINDCQGIKAVSNSRRKRELCE